MSRSHCIAAFAVMLVASALSASPASWSGVSLKSSLSTSRQAEASLHKPVLRMRGGAKKKNVVGRFLIFAACSYGALPNCAFMVHVFILVCCLTIPASQQVVGRKVLDEFSHDVTQKDGTQGAAKVEVVRDGSMLELTVTNPFPGQKMWLHWGFANRNQGWYAPPEQYKPDGTNNVDDKACQTPFTETLQLRVDVKDAPEAIAFCLKKDSPEEWYSGPTGDFWVAFKPADPGAVGGLILEKEIQTSHWSILDRMRLVGENIKCVAESSSGMSWLYTLLRFNQMKLIPLTRNSNYQSKDLAHTQKGVSMSLAAVYGKVPATRMWSRLCINLVPRGGGNGDAIRLEILDIMRRHGIKEGHRPGIEDKFIEEWHQKLHTNCAPDDIIIAEAYIRFLETGNPDDYWGHLHGNGLSYDYMASIGGGKGSANSGLAGLTATPMHLPQLCDDIKHLRWTLMQVGMREH